MYVCVYLLSVSAHCFVFYYCNLTINHRMGMAAMSDASLQHWREGVGAYNAGDIQRAIHQFKAAAPSKGVLFNLGSPSH